MDPHLMNIVKILVSVALGGIIGYERERAGHFAGIRTHMLVCLTSAMVISVTMGFFEMDSVARIAATIFTGIGFIGAGSILFTGRQVHGLTTAASVWAVSALGIVVALGAFIEAIVVTLILIVVLELKIFGGANKRL